MRRVFVMCFVTFALLGACKHDVERTGLPGSQEIRIRYEVNQPAEVSRSGGGGMAVGDVVHLYIAEREIEGAPQLPENEDFQQMECAAEGKLIFMDGEQHYYPAAPIDLYAFYQKDMTTQCDDVAAIGVEVYQDQTTEEGEWRSDFLYAVAANGFRNQLEPIGMTFRHQFARLKFTITTDTPSELDLKTLSAVEVNNIIMDGSFNLQSGKLSLGETEDYVLARIPETLEDGVTAIVIPQTVAEGIQVFCFQIAGEEFVYEAPAGGITFEAGKQYNYDICLNRYAGLSEKEVVVNMTTEEWNEVEGGTIMISKGEAAPVVLKDVVEGVAITKADLYFGETVVADILVENNRMEFVFPRLVEDETVLLAQARFYTDEGESFNYYFNDKELIGNGTDTLSLPAPKIGDSWGEGVVFVVGEVIGYNEETGTLETNMEGVNAYRGRMIADTIFGKYSWTKSTSQDGFKALIGMSDKDDGAKNVETLATFIISHGESVDNYPTYKAISALNGWYVPALNEIIHIFTYQEVLSKTLIERSGDGIDGDVDIYVTSTEYAAYLGESASDRESEMCSVGANSRNLKTPSPADKNVSMDTRIVKAF